MLTKRVQLIKSIVSLAASGVILIIAIGFAWFALHKEPQASGLILNAQAVDCKVVYTLEDNERFGNAKPGDIFTYEIKIYDITKTGMLTVELLGITGDEPFEFEGAMYDIRDAFSVTVIRPDDSIYTDIPHYLSGMSDLTILSDYPVQEEDIVFVRFEFAFLNEPNGIDDINLFQGQVGFQISELSVIIK